MDIKEAIKEKIRKLISESFDDYVSDRELEETGWEFLRSELGLVGWDRELYYTRSEAVGEAEATMWKKIEDLADEYGLDADELWKNYVMEPAVMLDDSYEDLLKEKGLEDAAKYVGIGYDDREGGFLVLVSPEVVSKLLDADVDKVAEEFVKQIEKEELDDLEREYRETVKEYEEEGWEVNEQEILEKVAKSYLEEQGEALAWLYAEESESMKKFIEAVKEVEKDLIAYLSDVDYKEEFVRDVLDKKANLRRKRS